MRQPVKLICSKCDHEGTAPADIEYGIVYLVEDSDIYCPECGMECEVDRHGAESMIAEERADRDRKEREYAREYFSFGRMFGGSHG